METLHNNGFLQLVSKATRIQGTHFSLIDHICIKNEPATLRTGTIISDFSDHFINFILFPVEKSRTSLSNKGYFLDRIINKNIISTIRKFVSILMKSLITSQARNCFK